MQLSPPTTDTPVPTDVATAVTLALAARGPGPAVTVVRPGRREEQGVASLAQWAAKGAHLLEAELLLTRGDRLHVDVAPGWPLAAVCLAAWWAGIAVDLTDTRAEVAVVHEGRSPRTGGDVLWTGDDLDGGPLGSAGGPGGAGTSLGGASDRASGSASGSTGEAWVTAVQSWPDAPPPPGAAADAPALLAEGRTWTQRELLAEAATIGRGRLGIEASRLDAITAVLTLAARPVATPHATVLLVGVDRDTAAGERVTTWWPA